MVDARQLTLRAKEGTMNIIAPTYQEYKLREAGFNYCMCCCQGLAWKPRYNHEPWLWIHNTHPAIKEDIWHTSAEARAGSHAGRKGRLHR
eukprot:4999321-Heterocapsa_arctica.AAC.1